MKHVGWAVALLLLVPAGANPAVLGTATVTNGGSIFGTERRVRPAFGYDIGNAAVQRALFDETWIDSTSVGSVLEATAESDTDFVALAARLANDTQDYVCIGTCEDISCMVVCAPESLCFSLGSTDFSPATVNKVSLGIDALSFGLDSRGGQIVLFSFTITVEGDPGVVPVRATSWVRLKARYR